MEGHQEQENTLNQLLVEMDGELIIHTCVHAFLYNHCKPKYRSGSACKHSLEQCLIHVHCSLGQCHVHVDTHFMLYIHIVHHPT